MIYPSKRMALWIPCLTADLGDALVVCERSGVTLGEALCEALHLGLASYVDKWEALLYQAGEDAPPTILAAHDQATVLLNAFWTRPLHSAERDGDGLALRLQSGEHSA